MSELALVHAVREPLGGRRDAAPLLVLLHGLRSNEQDLLQLAPLFDERLLVVSARAPLRLGHAAYAWYRVEFTPQGFDIDLPSAENSRQVLLRFVHELLSTYHVDRSRVFLGGFSQGAAMTAAAALSEPRLFAGAIVMSGRLAGELRSGFAPPEQMAGLPVLAVHGTQDEVIPIRHGRALRDELAALPVALTYREYEMAHEVTPRSAGDIAQWLTARLDGADWRTVDE